MTPKGGIRPHNRFSIKAKRSEVLFVDYIAEHLNPSGRAGIIVPEGIIFQGQNAYKNLRRMLVENYLWAVVSLPAGVFNPYSGVKTSVLFLNLNLAKRMDDVLFVKVQNDGFDLGAQRRPIEGSDLTSALRIIENHKKGHRTEENRMAHAVSRKRILESTDVGLSGDRYRPVAVRAHDKWPMVKLGEIAMDVKSGFACGTSDDNKEGIPHLRPMNISTDGQLVWEGTKYISKEVFAGKSDYLLEMGDVLFNNTNSKELVGKTCLVVNDLQAGFSNHLTRIRSNPQRMRPALLALFLHYLWRRGSFLELCNKWIGQAGINNTKLVDIEIPIPPIEEQERIVAELEGYRKVIDGARQVIANYKPAIRIDPEWLIIPLGDVITLQRGYDLPKTQFANGDVPVVGSNGIIGYHDVRKEEGPGVVTGRSGTIGKVHFIDYEYYWPHNTALFVRDFKGNDKKFIMYLLQSIDLKSLGDNVAAVPSLDRKNAHRIPVPLPPLDVQRRIVAELEAERKLVEANRDLIARMEARIRAKLAEVWGDVEE
jgi:type I restriction enzyme M protein